jgi:putative transcriptional regulator
VSGFKGSLLLASAGIEGGVFRKTVILVAEHDEKGALGFVLNHPSQALVDEIAPSLNRYDVLDERLYIGGPVQPEIVAIIAEFRTHDPDTSMIFDDVGFAPAEGPEVPAGLVRARAFAGYAGWGPGQLEREMEEDSWIVEPATKDDVFAGDADRLWSDVVKRKGPRFTLLATMPLDPSVN